MNVEEQKCMPMKLIVQPSEDDLQDDLQDVGNEINDSVNFMVIVFRYVCFPSVSYN